MKALLSTAVAIALSLSACAHAGGLVDLSVIDRDTGSVLPTHGHGGKLYVAGIPGHRYSVRLYNHSSERVMTVLSVDGVNAVTGQTADPNQSGYVLDAWQSTDIEGWRKNMSEIAQFNFTALDNSYAARTGRPNNVGVIGVAVFREKAPPIWRERDDRISQRDSAPSQPGSNAAAEPAPARPVATPPPASAAGSFAEAAKSANAPQDRADGALGARAHRKTEESLGTGHGARESSYASYTTFERASSRPDEVDSLFYDSYRNLVARGVLPQARPLAVEPQPFPNHFVPDPAG